VNAQRERPGGALHLTQRRRSQRARREPTSLRILAAFVVGVPHVTFVSAKATSEAAQMGEQAVHGFL